ncbi:MAG: hypothetical protein H0T92_24330, partial [Pyrinomonadaceae bacterium]|nr:hypothetical protein [Pyrinomonadaceae bacterium]
MINTLEMIEETGERRAPISAGGTIETRRLRRLEVVCWVIALMLGLLHAWASRHNMDGDGISYLDMGEAYWRGDWRMAVNGYWSPLYSWLLGAALFFLRPSSYWEFAAAHLVNLLVYVAALGSFAFFLREMIRYQQSRAAGGGWTGLPGWAWVVVGYALFVWSSLELITLRYVTPDMCVAACVYLAAGLVVRIRRERELAGSRTFALLGLVLGLGYLAKAAMFPLSFVFLGVGWSA